MINADDVRDVRAFYETVAITYKTDTMTAYFAILKKMHKMRLIP